MRVERFARRLPGSLAGALAVCLVAGCSGGKQVAEVSGKVTYKDRPVTAGTVRFFPDDGSEPVGTPLGPDGTYRATGVPVGHCRVAVETLQFRTMTPPPPGMAKQLGGPKPVYVPIPDKYERPESSGLELDVKKGTNDWPIALPD